MYVRFLAVNFFPTISKTELSPDLGTYPNGDTLSKMHPDYKVVSTLYKNEKGENLWEKGKL